MPTFDPTKQCPVIRNFECVQDECAFWNADKVQCLYFDGLVGKQEYNEIAGLISGAVVDDAEDLGAIYRDLTILVDAACSIKFHDVSHPIIVLDALSNRVGTPVFFRNINARYIFVTTTGDTNITIDGNG